MARYRPESEAWFGRLGHLFPWDTAAAYLADLETREANVPTPYLDPGGVRTVGRGITEGPFPGIWAEYDRGAPLGQQDLDELALYYALYALNAFEAAHPQVARSLPPEAMKAVLDLLFNAGAENALSFPKAREALEAGDYERYADEAFLNTEVFRGLRDDPRFEGVRERRRRAHAQFVGAVQQQRESGPVAPPVPVSAPPPPVAPMASPPPFLPGGAAAAAAFVGPGRPALPLVPRHAGEQQSDLPPPAAPSVSPPAPPQPPPAPPQPPPPPPLPLQAQPPEPAPSPASFAPQGAPLAAASRTLAEAMPEPGAGLMDVVRAAIFGPDRPAPSTAPEGGPHGDPTLDSAWIQQGATPEDRVQRRLAVANAGDHRTAWAWLTPEEAEITPLVHDSSDRKIRDYLRGKSAAFIEALKPTIPRTIGAIQQVIPDVGGFFDAGAAQRVTAVADALASPAEKGVTADLRQIDSARAAWEFAGYMMGQVVPSMAPGIAGSTVGAVTGGALGGPPGAVVGGIAGGLAGAWPVGREETYAEFAGRRGRDPRGTPGAVAKLEGAAAAAAALEALWPSLPIGRIAAKVPWRRVSNLLRSGKGGAAAREIRQGLGRTTAGKQLLAVGKDTASESISEFAGELIRQAGAASAAAQPLAGEDLWAAANEAAAAAITGAPLSAIGRTGEFVAGRRGESGANEPAPPDEQAPAPPPEQSPEAPDEVGAPPDWRPQWDDTGEQEAETPETPPGPPESAGPRAPEEEVEEPREPGLREREVVPTPDLPAAPPSLRPDREAEPPLPAPGRPTDRLTTPVSTEPPRRTDDEPLPEPSGAGAPQEQAPEESETPDQRPATPAPPSVVPLPPGAEFLHPRGDAADRPAPPPESPPGPAQPGGRSPDSASDSEFDRERRAQGEPVETLAERFRNLDPGVSTRTKAFRLIARLRGGDAAGVVPAQPNTPEGKRDEEIIEAAVLIAGRDLIRGQTPERALDLLFDLQSHMPTLGTRTVGGTQEGGGSDDRQAYSTPLPVAFLASRMTGAREPAKRVLEPTAGNGNLLLERPPGRNTWANEIDSNRRSVLQREGFIVTDHMAQFLPETSEPFGIADVVLANPPFGTMNEEMTLPPWAHGATAAHTLSASVKRLDHAIAGKALGRLARNGRAAIILGSPTTPANLDALVSREDPQGAWPEYETFRDIPAMRRTYQAAWPGGGRVPLHIQSPIDTALHAVSEATGSGERVPSELLDLLHRQNYRQRDIDHYRQQVDDAVRQAVNAAYRAPEHRSNRTTPDFVEVPTTAPARLIAEPRERREDYRDRNSAFYEWLWHNFRVTQHLTIHGDQYKKQGAGWPIELIIVDQRPRQEQTTAPPPWERAPDVLRTEIDIKEALKRYEQQGEPADAGPDDGGDGGVRGAPDAGRDRSGAGGTGGTPAPDAGVADAGRGVGLDDGGRGRSEGGQDRGPAEFPSRPVRREPAGATGRDRGRGSEEVRPAAPDDPPGSTGPATDAGHPTGDAGSEPAVQSDLPVEPSRHPIPIASGDVVDDARVLLEWPYARHRLRQMDWVRDNTGAITDPDPRTPWAPGTVIKDLLAANGRAGSFKDALTEIALAASNSTRKPPQSQGTRGRIFEALGGPPPQQDEYRWDLVAMEMIRLAAPRLREHHWHLSPTGITTDIGEFHDAVKRLLTSDASPDTRIARWIRGHETASKRIRNTIAAGFPNSGTRREGRRREPDFSNQLLREIREIVQGVPRTGGPASETDQQEPTPADQQQPSLPPVPEDIKLTLSGRYRRSYVRKFMDEIVFSMLEDDLFQAYMSERRWHIDDESGQIYLRGAPPPGFTQSSMSLHRLMERLYGRWETPLNRQRDDEQLAWSAIGVAFTSRPTAAGGRILPNSIAERAREFVLSELLSASDRRAQTDTDAERAETESAEPAAPSGQAPPSAEGTPSDESEQVADQESETGQDRQRRLALATLSEEAVIEAIRERDWEFHREPMMLSGSDEPLFHMDQVRVQGETGPNARFANAALTRLHFRHHPAFSTVQAIAAAANDIRTASGEIAYDEEVRSRILELVDIQSAPEGRDAGTVLQMLARNLERGRREVARWRMTRAGLVRGTNGPPSAFIRRAISRGGFGLGREGAEQFVSEAEEAFEAIRQAEDREEGHDPDIRRRLLEILRLEEPAEREQAPPPAPSSRRRRAQTQQRPPPQEPDAPAGAEPAPATVAVPEKTVRTRLGRLPSAARFYEPKAPGAALDTPSRDEISRLEEWKNTWQTRAVSSLNRRNPSAQLDFTRRLRAALDRYESRPETTPWMTEAGKAYILWAARALTRTVGVPIAWDDAAPPLAPSDPTPVIPGLPEQARGDVQGSQTESDHTAAETVDDSVWDEFAAADELDDALGGDAADADSARDEILRQAASAFGQVPYVPVARGISRVPTQIPAALQEATQQALEDLRDAEGEIDGYVADHLRLQGAALNNALSREQIDTMGLAIRQFELDGAIVVGHQTGMGKGRIAMSALRWAWINNLPAVFFTAKKDLYHDAGRDLLDIGIVELMGRRPRILITDETGVSMPNGLDDIPPASNAERLRELDRVREALRNGAGRAPAGYDFIFTTHHQMAPIEGIFPHRATTLNELFRSGNVVMVMDEAHKGAVLHTAQDLERHGGRNQYRGHAPDERFRHDNTWVKGADATAEMAGRAKTVMYLSATWAYSADRLAAYSRAISSSATAAGQSLERTQTLLNRAGQAALGAVPVQMARDGRYVRMEQSFQGVQTHFQEIPVAQAANYEAIANHMWGIVEFDEAVKSIIREMMDAQGRDSLALMHTSMFSGGHNLISALLLSLKAREVIGEVKTAVDAGEKVVIGLENTVESIIENAGEPPFMLLESKSRGAQPGAWDEGWPTDARGLLLRFLWNTRRYNVRRGPREPSTPRILTDAELPTALMQDFRRLWYEILNDPNLARYPMSPIDYIRHALEEQGVSTGEITARKTGLDYEGEAPTKYQRSNSEVGAQARRRTIDRFNDGDLDVVVINAAGSTGISLHASELFNNQDQRTMFIVQPMRKIDEALQMLGRVHRIGQRQPPKYRFIFADLPLEKRIAMVFRARMEAMNATTSGDSDTGLGVGDETVNLMDARGYHVAQDWASQFEEVNRQLDRPVQEPGREDSEETMSRRVTEAQDIRRLTGRLSFMPLATMQEHFDWLVDAYQAQVAFDRQLGRDVEGGVMPLDAAILSSTEIEDGLTLNLYDVAATGRSRTAEGVVEGILDGVEEYRDTAPAQVEAFLAAVAAAREAGQLPAAVAEAMHRQENTQERLMGNIFEWAHGFITGALGPEGAGTGENLQQGRFDEIEGSDAWRAYVRERVASARRVRVAPNAELTRQEQEEAQAAAEAQAMRDERRRLGEILESFQDDLGPLVPGTPLTLQAEGSVLQGIVLSLDPVRARPGANPLSPGLWRIKIAVPTHQNMMVINQRMLIWAGGYTDVRGRPVLDAQESQEISDQGVERVRMSRANRVRVQRQRVHDSVHRLATAFDRSHAEGERERRVIVESEDILGALDWTFRHYGEGWQTRDRPRIGIFSRQGLPPTTGVLLRRGTAVEEVSQNAREAITDIDTLMQVLALGEGREIRSEGRPPAVSIVAEEDGWWIRMLGSAAKNRELNENPEWRQQVAGRDGFGVNDFREGERTRRIPMKRTTISTSVRAAISILRDRGNVFPIEAGVLREIRGLPPPRALSREHPDDIWERLVREFGNAQAANRPYTQEERIALRTRLRQESERVLGHLGKDYRVYVEEQIEGIFRIASRNVQARRSEESGLYIVPTHVHGEPFAVQPPGDLGADVLAMHIGGFNAIGLVASLTPRTLLAKLHHEHLHALLGLGAFSRDEYRQMMEDVPEEILHRVIENYGYATAGMPEDARAAYIYEEGVAETLAAVAVGMAQADELQSPVWQEILRGDRGHMAPRRARELRSGADFRLPARVRRLFLRVIERILLLASVVRQAMRRSAGRARDLFARSAARFAEQTEQARQRVNGRARRAERAHEDPVEAAWEAAENLSRLGRGELPDRLREMQDPREVVEAAIAEDVSADAILSHPVVRDKFSLEVGEMAQRLGALSPEDADTMERHRGEDVTLRYSFPESRQAGSARTVVRLLRTRTGKESPRGQMLVKAAPFVRIRFDGWVADLAAQARHVWRPASDFRTSP